MRTMQRLFGSSIAVLANLAILLYVCRRFLVAARLRGKITTEMREFASIVRRARDNVLYIGDRVARGMEEIREDVGRELRVTDRLTTQSAKLATLLQRFAKLEETVIELVRMDRNRESVRLETPVDVNEEIKRIVTAASEGTSEGRREDTGRTPGGRFAERNPLSRFSACGPREFGSMSARARKSVEVADRSRGPTRPEVRLLAEANGAAAAVEFERSANAKREDRFLSWK